MGMELNLIQEFRAHPRHAQSVMFSRDGTELATTGMDALVQVWSAPGFENLRSLRGHEKSVNAIALSPDGATAVTGSTDREVMVWDWKSGERLHSFSGHRNTVAAVAFSPNGEVAASSSYGGRVGLWEAGSDSLDVFRSHPRHVTSLSFSNDGGSLAASGLGNIVKIWDVRTRELLTEIEAPGQAATGCLFLPKAETFAAPLTRARWSYTQPIPMNRMASGFPQGGRLSSMASDSRLRQPDLLRGGRGGRARPERHGDFGPLRDGDKGNVRRGLLAGWLDGGGGERRWPVPSLGDR